MFKAKTKGGTGSTGSSGTGGDYGTLSIPGDSMGRTIAYEGNVFTHSTDPYSTPSLSGSDSVYIDYIDGDTEFAMILANGGTYQVTFGVSVAEIPVGECFFYLAIGEGTAVKWSACASCSPAGAGTMANTLTNLMISTTCILTFAANTRLSVVNGTETPVTINSLGPPMLGLPTPTAYITVFRLQ